MLVRVYQPVGAPVRIVYPNYRLQLPRETEAACLARLCVITEQHDVTLQGLPSIDVDASTLPAERLRTVANTEYDARKAWRISAGAVTISEKDVTQRAAADAVRRTVNQMRSKKR